MAFLLQRVVLGIGRAEQLQLSGPDLEALSLARRGHEFAGHGHGRARAEFRQQVVPLYAVVHHDLKVRQAGAVVDLQKRKALGVAAGADPAHDADRARAFAARERRLDGGAPYAHASSFQVKVKGQETAPEAMVPGRSSRNLSL
ncbi:hypothetical protein DSECCO2_660440 [anaerobic digester metagenome]